MKQDKKKKFQVGDTVWVKGGFIGTVARITPFTVWVKPEDVVGVSHCRIIPTIDRKPTLRQKIGLWWYRLFADVKAVFIISVINAVVLIGWTIAVSIIK